MGDDRHRRTTGLTSGLEWILRPRSVAVIGATDRPGTIGYTIMHNLVSNSYNYTPAEGLVCVRLWPVNEEVQPRYRPIPVAPPAFPALSRLS